VEPAEKTIARFGLAAWLLIKLMVRGSGVGARHCRAPTKIPLKGSPWKWGRNLVPEVIESKVAQLTAHIRSGWPLALVFVALSAAGCAARSPLTTSVPSPPAPQTEPATASAPPKSKPLQPAASNTPSPTRSAPFVPGIYVEQGVASWYGVPFNGRRAANGEIFDMNTLVAAHRTLPFGSVLRVTNLNNGRDVEVRVIDRGPFVGDRILDLARAAAVSIDMIGTGTAPVRIELLSGPSPAGGEFTVQVGAFADRVNAERLRDRLLAAYQPIFIQEYDTPAGHFYRVRVGRVPSPDAAQQLAAQLRASDGFQTFVMRLDQVNGLSTK
jgi:rare lipoprotein A